MVSINSDRAKKLLSHPHSFLSEKTIEMRKFPGLDFEFYASIDFEGQVVKKLSFFGDLNSFEKVLLEALGVMALNKNSSFFQSVSLRECEAYLRDKNSELSLVGLSEQDDIRFKKIFTWLYEWPVKGLGIPYHFSSEKGSFSRLKLIEKTREMQAFLSSQEILALYQNHTSPRLVSVEGLTVYVMVPYTSEEEKSLFENLHMLGVLAFQNENLNFIPEEYS